MLTMDVLKARALHPDGSGLPHVLPRKPGAAPYTEAVDAAAAGGYVSPWRQAPGNVDGGWMMQDRKLRSKLLYSSLTTSGM